MSVGHDGLPKTEVPGAFDIGARAYDRLVGANPGYHGHLRISARRMRIADGGRGMRLLDAQPEHPRARCIAARGPFALEDERALFANEGFDVLISKNSGGNATEAKLQVARERGLPVLILQRPPLPEVERSFADPDTLWQALQPLL